MVYEALTGANPYRARTPDELRERHRHPPRSLADLRPDLPRSLAAACARALESHPRRRPSAAAFGRVLSAAADAIERPGEREQRSPARDAPGPRRPAPAFAPRPAAACPRCRALSALPRPHVDVALGEWGEGLSRCGLPDALRGRRGARRASPPAAACCALADRVRARRVPVLAVRPRAAARLAGAALALASPWLAAAFALAVCVPALGDVSAGLAWCVALAGGLWLVACVRAGRRALLPAAAPLLAAVFLWPLYVLAAGSLRSVLGRALAGAAGPVRDRALGRRPAGRLA